MISVRKSADRGLSQHPWLKSFHTFSFADYHDLKYMGFRSLRVINEDFIKGGKGFDTHPHRDMEIITYVIKGSLQHQDSMGNKTIIQEGEVQRMSAGTGIMHSEYNHELDSDTHLYQIWITPNSKGITPSYGQKSFKSDLDKNKSVLIISPDGRDGSISIHQDAEVYLSKLKKDETLDYQPKIGRHVWVQVLKGKIKVEDEILTAGDAFSSESTKNHLIAMENSEFMIFDLN